MKFPDPDSMESCRKELRDHIVAIQKNPERVSTPITDAINVGALMGSGKADDRTAGLILEGLGTILAQVEGMAVRLGRLESGPTKSGLPSKPEHFNEYGGPKVCPDCGAPTMLDGAEFTVCPKCSFSFPF